MDEQRPRAQDPADLIEQAVGVLMVTNRCDRPAAQAILTATATQHRLSERDVATTLLALSKVPRTHRRTLR